MSPIEEIINRLNCLIDSWQLHMEATDKAVTDAYRQCIADLKGTMENLDIPRNDRDYLK